MSPKKVEHDRIAYNFVQLLSDAGGLANVMRALFQVLILFINRHYIDAKFVRFLYFKKNPNKSQ